MSSGSSAIPKSERRAHWIDAGALLLHYVLWVGMPLLFLPVPAVIAFYVLRNILLGYAMYAILAPGHFPADAQRTTEEARHEDTISIKPRLREP